MANDDPLGDLLALSKQIREAAVLGGSGFVVACSAPPERGEDLARLATELLAVARRARDGADGHRVTRVEVLHEAGGMFVVEDEGRAIVATTVPDATAALVVYDLRTTLGRVAAAETAAPPRRAGSSDA